uniref:Uncharacterized protein n=1 Tax=Romanomermis culicivorax TaxID=13658 RepID=A0A915HP85_ROMCU
MAFAQLWRHRALELTCKDFVGATPAKEHPTRMSQRCCGNPAKNSCQATKNAKNRFLLIFKVSSCKT